MSDPQSGLTIDIGELLEAPGGAVVVLALRDQRATSAAKLQLYLRLTPDEAMDVGQGLMTIGHANAARMKASADDTEDAMTTGEPSKSRAIVNLSVHTIGVKRPDKDAVIWPGTTWTVPADHGEQVEIYLRGSPGTVHVEEYTDAGLIVVR